MNTNCNVLNVSFSLFITLWCIYFTESHKTKSPDQKLVHEVDSFNKRFMDCEQELMSRLQDHLPRDKLGLRHIVEQQKV